MNFSNCREHSSPLFKLLSIVKLCDLVKFHISVFMFKFYNGLLPPAFEHFFTPVKSIHSYNTRSAANQSHYIPRVVMASTILGKWHKIMEFNWRRHLTVQFENIQRKIEKGIYKYLLIFISCRVCYML